MFRIQGTPFYLGVIVVLVLGVILSACGQPATPAPEEPTEAPAAQEEPAEPEPTEPSAQEAPADATVTSEPAAEEKAGIVNYGHHPEPDTLDPASSFSSWNQIELKALYDTLVWWGPDKEYYPGLAESWEVSEDVRTYTFRLRQDVMFHDGTPLTAEAVKTTFDRIGVDSTTIGKGAEGLMGSYMSTEIVDEYTVEVNFENPFPAFINSVSDPFLSIVSPTALEEFGEDFGQNPVGTGPFIFQEWVAQDHVTVVRNPDYNWAPEFFEHQGPAYLDSVTFRYLPEDTTRVGSLEAGETNFISRVPVLDVDRLENDPMFDVYTAETPMLPESILLNVQKYPLDDIQVRQAILHAVDPQTIVDTLFAGKYPVAYGPLSPANPFYWDGVEGMYPYDPERAKELLSEAGWEPGSDGIRVDSNGERLTLDLLYPGGEFRLRAYEFVQAQLREVGIEMTIQQMEAAAMVEQANAGENHLSQLQWGFSDPTGMNIMWHSMNEGTGFNWSHVRNDRVDELLEAGDAEVDQEERAAIYQELQQIIMEEAYMLPLYVINAYHAGLMNVKGITVAPTARHIWLYDTYVEQ